MKRNHAKKANLTRQKPKSWKRFLIHLWTRQKLNEIENQTTSEVFDPFMDQTNDQKEYKTLNEIKEDIQDSTWNQTEKKVTCENEDRVANSNGRFPCKYCTQTFSKNIYAISHEKKSCKSRSNKI